MAEQTTNGTQEQSFWSFNNGQGGFAMLAQGAGGIASMFPTPNADLNSNNQMAAGAREGISNALLTSGNPYAMAAGAAVKILDKTGGFSDVSEGLGEGTDFGNAAMSFLLPGAGYFLPKTNEYKMSNDMQIMSNAYQGSVSNANTAMNNSGAKLWFGRGKANGMIADAQNIDDIIKKIKEQSDVDYLSMATMTQNRAMSNAYNLAGGYNQAFARAARLGAKLKYVEKKQIGGVIEEIPEVEEVPEEVEILQTTPEQNAQFFQNMFKDEEGESITIGDNKEHNAKFFENLSKEIKPNRKLSYSDWYKTLPIDKRNTDNYDLEKAYNDSEITNEELERFASDPQAHLDGRYKKSNHMTYSDEGYGWQGSDENGWTFKVSPRQSREHTFEEYQKYWNENEPNSILDYNGKQYWKGKIQFNKEGGKIKIKMADNSGYVEVDKLDEDQKAGRKPIGHKNGKRLYLNGDGKAVYVEDPEKEQTQYKKEGGQMNVIPEGSLHARLHHMENVDNLTKKGIPVIDNNGEQTAEIEKEEIVFNLDVTKKLEELCKKYKSDDYTNKEKEDFAIEAGKLLAVQIMENTEDRVGLINTI